MNVTLGGERIGSGNKMNLHLRNYERSTHNLSTTFRSPMGVGILTPCYCKPVMRGDKFDINIAAGIRTIPSKGALFGSYKLQVDYYFCPVRLYVGILHNNPTNIGLNMKNVLFPTMKQGLYNDLTSPILAPFARNSLLHYLGLSGIGNISANSTGVRKFNAIPVLAYYDIFKNYYSNKQEEKAYILSTKNTVIKPPFEVSEIYNDTQEEQIQTYQSGSNFEGFFSATESDRMIINYGGSFEQNKSAIQIAMYVPGYSFMPLEAAEQVGMITDLQFDENDQTIVFGIGTTSDFVIRWQKVATEIDNELEIKPYDLNNIDEMRMELLSFHTFGAAYNVNSFNKLPYSAVAQNTNEWAANNNQQNLNGLALKTYQSDMFNNWLSTEYIDGVNGIANITKVSTEGGGFTIDSLNYAQKMYDLLNRVVASGNTYEDYQDVVWEETPKRHLESPMYIGGISQEIVFEEILSTAATEQAGLGQMGGRGLSRHRKGGHIRLKADEAGFIIGIASITPRVSYGQGNEFYFTDLYSMDDLHKPALDGIGFQDLIGERMAYFDTIVNDGTDDITRHVVGKLPAWIEYMSDVDRVHGDFADDNENSFMVLTRKYEFDSENRCIKDATTYVEPEKYNDAFLYTNLDSQNFWAQIDHEIIARRKMSAKQIPNI